jgi:23S rRNA (guanine745-N1)-methyltransferase
VQPVRAPLPLTTLSEWLRCPNCFADLHPAEALVLSCPNGHRFDVNRRGYASLIAGSRRLIGDSPAMLDARDTFLERGWYAELRAALSDLVAAESAHRVIDIGCGTGYYLRGVLAALARTSPAASDLSADDPADVAPSALAVDLSAPAVARTVRAAVRTTDSRTAGLVADVWSPLPIRDGAADVLINVFAPRNPAEFHRIVAPGGLLAVVVPHPTHLQELRADGLALDVHENKTADLISSLMGLFDLEQSRDLSAVLSLSPDDVAALIGMGPSAHHPRPAGEPGSAEAPEPVRPEPVRPEPVRPVTVAFRLLAFRRGTS